MSNIRVRHQNNILWLILDRPPLNILSIEMLDQLTAVMREAVEQKPRLVVLMGAGERAFSAGVDVRDHLEGREREMLRAVYDNCAAFDALRAAPARIACRLPRRCGQGGNCLKLLHAASNRAEMLSTRIDAVMSSAPPQASVCQSAYGLIAN